MVLGFELLYIFFKNLFQFFDTATQHVESWLPDQRQNPHPLLWKQRVLTLGLPEKLFELLFSKGFLQKSKIF